MPSAWIALLRAGDSAPGQTVRVSAHAVLTGLLDGGVVVGCASYLMMRPPSAHSTWPVIAAAASEAK